MEKVTVRVALPPFTTPPVIASRLGAPRSGAWRLATPRIAATSGSSAFNTTVAAWAKIRDLASAYAATDG